MSLKSLLATTLSPGQEEKLAANAQHVLSALLSNPGVLDADEQTQQKLRVRISALFKSKNAVSRWFGCVLCKVVLQSASCWVMIKSHGVSWCGSLLHLLERSEPLATHQVAIETLSELFSRTFGKAAMTREITTPRIGDYVKALLNLASKEPQLWKHILPALTLVLRQQSTTFRPYTGKFTELLMTLLNKSCQESMDPNLLYSVCEGFVCLHMAAPKGKEMEEWRQGLYQVTSEIHYALGQLGGKFINEEFQWDESRPRLQGLHDCEPVHKVESLLRVLKSFFTTETKTMVKLPVGEIMTLADRIFSMPFAPERPATDKDDREMFKIQLEQISVGMAEVVTLLLGLIGSAGLSYHDMLIHHVIVVTGHTTNQLLKVRLIELVTRLFTQISILPAAFNENIATLVNTCMKMLEPAQPPQTSQIPDFVTQPEAFKGGPHSSIVRTVDCFLHTVVLSAPDLPLPTRSVIDRYFIVSDNSRGSTMSALYPGNIAKYSTLPMALRMKSEDTLVQAIHPRFPPIVRSIQSINKQAVFHEETNQLSEGQHEMIETAGDTTNSPPPVMAVTDDAITDDAIQEPPLKRQRANAAITETSKTNTVVTTSSSFFSTKETVSESTEKPQFFPARLGDTSRHEEVDDKIENQAGNEDENESESESDNDDSDAELPEIVMDSD